MEINTTTPGRTAIDGVAQQWSPEDLRLARVRQRQQKDRGTKRGTWPLSGGDYLLFPKGNGSYETSTLSFCFKARNLDPYRHYGLTVGHVAKRVGDKVFAFSEDVPSPDGRKSLAEIGTVVSLSQESDSLIIQFHLGIRVKCLEICQADGFRQDIVLPPRNEEAPAEPSAHTKFIVFGAIRRGAIGYFEALVDKADRDILKGDIKMLSRDTEGNEPDGRKKLTELGDCGAVCADEGGTAWSIHHVLGFKNGTYISYGIPLPAIMDSHPKYFRRFTGTDVNPRKSRSCWFSLKAVWRRYLRHTKRAQSRAIPVTKKASMGANPALLRQSTSLNFFSVCKTTPVPTDSVGTCRTESDSLEIINQRLFIPASQVKIVPLEEEVQDLQRLFFPADEFQIVEY